MSRNRISLTTLRIGLGGRRVSPLVFPSADAMADNREAGEETTAVDSVATGQGAFGQLAPGSSRLFRFNPAAVLFIEFRISFCADGSISGHRSAYNLA